MNKNILKSILSILAGFISGTLVTLAADFVLTALALIDMNHFSDTPGGLVFLVLLYRFLFSILACYVTARLSPNRPMRHAMILGGLGFLLSLAGAVFMWEAAPAWYNVAVVLMALPCAWLGGRWFEKTQASKKQRNLSHG